ncbi:Benomyl/methotrexate resistance protein [Arthroderma uncinatum]|uniref:Benomyl/methotrexate resistance protein n=1 Tax=Arthroderma uncinatum TaxID=74035 RepID=UPI00144AECAC|nr:Benomyl/methotrexate resistance protein [Arthroderma uncinatum]KAF3482423.1 Benomyl/methotrexate resistance protein [Arthroderma uncinatum]
MADLFRDSVAGQLLRYAFPGTLQYPEEKLEFKLPPGFQLSGLSSNTSERTLSGLEERKPDAAGPQSINGTSEGPTVYPDPDSSSPNSKAGVDSRSVENDEQPEPNVLKTNSDLEGTPSRAIKDEVTDTPIMPEESPDGIVLVDWYSPDDQENPQNWSNTKKNLVAAQIFTYTFAVYMGSSIYTSSIPDIQIVFGVSTTVASLGLSLYVLGYGVGPMLFSPLSEMPIVGRNPPYIVTFGLFVILSLPTALADNFAGLITLRFLQGFFGSPCLATGGASLGDMYPFVKLPYALAIWVVFASVGPALGPPISGFSVPALNWRWSLWEILIFSGPVFLVLFFFLPETSGDTILLKRAARLRKLTGNPKLSSQSEIKQAKMRVSKIIVEAAWRPYQIMFLDPAILFANVYTSLVYGIYYSFFEVFPIVYTGIYEFNLGETGLVFLTISVSNALAIVLYFTYLYLVFEPEIKAHGLKYPERRLIPAIYFSVLASVGLFLFGWTCRSDVHWIASAIGVVVFTVGIFIVIQCIFVYIPISYPQYAASLFAGNDLVRSAVAAAAILFSGPLFGNLGVVYGVTLLAWLTVGCVGGMFALYHYGARLRARSRFAVSE